MDLNLLLISIAFVFGVSMIAAHTLRLAFRPLPILAATLTFHFAILSSLSLPKPEWLELREAETTVLAYHYIPDETIYLWLLYPGDPTPRAYQFPWDTKLAEKLDEQRQNGRPSGFQMERSWDNQPRLPYDLPQPAMPEKSPPQPPAETFQFEL